jgi:hypothetical protein
MKICPMRKVEGRFAPVFRKLDKVSQNVPGGNNHFEIFPEPQSHMASHASGENTQKKLIIRHNFFSSLIEMCPMQSTVWGHP